jgi:uncharacterized cupin superfamily protein
MRVQNTDLAKQLEAPTLGVRRWRLVPGGQASTKHRHFKEHELYVVLEGTGRMRIGDELLTLELLSAVAVDPPVRQIFNDTDADALWLVAGSPSEFSNTRERTPERLEALYPDGPKALPRELQT